MDNGSDIEISDIEDQYPQAEIHRKLTTEAHVSEDRLASKKVWKQLEITFSSPTTQRRAAIWIKGWKAWITTSRKKPDPISGPQSELIVRFLDETLRRTTPHGQSKSAPSESTFILSISSVYRYLEFTYPQWKETPHLKARVSSWSNQAVKEGRLIRGKWRKGQWITFNIFVNLAAAWFMDAFKNGCLNFDTILSRVLPLAMIVAINCRAGEVTQSSGWDTPAFMQLGDIELKLEDSSQNPNARKGLIIAGDHTASLSNSELNASYVAAFVKIRFGKGEKYSADYRTRSVLSLGGSAFNTVDIVLLLLAHGLRHGLFKHGVSLQDVLLAASQRQDRVIEWKNPELPFVPALKPPSSSHCELDKHTTTQQATTTLRKMALLAGYLDSITCHDLRRGSAKDLARIAKDKIFASDAGTARALGHSDTRMQQLYYNEDEDEPLNYLKPAIEASRVEWKMRRTAQPYQKPNAGELARMTSRFILANPEKCLREDAIFPVEWYTKIHPRSMKLNDSEEARNLRKIRKRAAKYALLEDYALWVTSQLGPKDKRITREQSDFIPVGLIPGCSATFKDQSSTSGDLNTAIFGLRPSSSPQHGQTFTTRAEDTLILTETEVGVDGDTQLPADLQEYINAIYNTSTIGNQEDTAEDIEEGVDNTLDEDTLFSRLHDISTSMSEDITPEDGCLDALELCFSSMEQTPCQLPKSTKVTFADQIKPPAEYTANQWVELLSTYNRVRNQSIPGGKFPTPKDFRPFIPSENSRDPPSLHYFQCPNCDYFTREMSKYNTHYQTCKTKYQRKQTDGGSFLWQGKKQKQQATSQNTYPCTYPGCDREFPKRDGRDHHVLIDHDFQIGGRCPLAHDCQSPDIFMSRAALERHLIDNHNEYAFEPRPCPFADTPDAKFGCETIMFTYLHDYNEHLRNTHPFSDTESTKPVSSFTNIDTEMSQPGKKMRTKSPERQEQKTYPIPCPFRNTPRAKSECEAVSFTLRTEHNRHIRNVHHLRGSEYQKHILKAENAD